MMNYNAQFSVILYNYTKNDITSETKNQEFLLFDSDKSVSIYVYHKNYEKYSDLLNDKEFLNSNKYNDSFLKNNGSNEIIGVDNIFNKGFIIYKDHVNITWEITNETDKILGYNCNSATTNFRGRKYKAWFTNDIPISTGPWKFIGLPGLILKISDLDNLVKFEAVRLELNSNQVLPSKYSNNFKSTKDIIDYKMFIELENKSLFEIRDKAIANLPKGVVFDNIPSIRENMIEKSFEWEETKKP